jgi:peptide-methionine (S)-S-oxide reductase
VRIAWTDFAQITAIKFNLPNGNQTGVLCVANMMNMMSRTRWILALVLTAGVLFGIKPIDVLAQAASNDRATAVFSGGCFWGVDAVFKHVKGVNKVVSGYAGGAANTAQYETVSTGKTGHAESVQVTYDPSKVSYDDLLKVFFLVAHDPTELNRQGPDSGTQYRSSIFYESDAQKKMADDYIAQLDQKHAFSGPIVTKVVPLTGFYPAEDYHQNYLELHPDQPYIVFNDLPKLEQFQKDLPGLYQQQAAK